MRMTWAMGGVVLGLVVLVDCATAPGPQDSGFIDGGSSGGSGGGDALSGGGAGGGIAGSGYGGGNDCGLLSGACRHGWNHVEVGCSNGAVQRCEISRAECFDPFLRSCPVGQVCFDGGSTCSLPDGSTTICAEARPGCLTGRWQLGSTIVTTTCDQPVAPSTFPLFASFSFQLDGGATCSALDPTVTWADATGCGVRVKYQARNLDPEQNWTVELQAEPADGGRLTGSGVLFYPADGGCSTQFSVNATPF